MSDTPETDDQEDYGKNSEWAKFTRKLERERNEAQIELQMWSDGNIMHEIHRDELEKTERERDEWKKAAFEITEQLERERDEARTELEMWRDGNILHENHRDELEKTERERDEAREQIAKLRDLVERAIKAIPAPDDYGGFSYVSAVIRAELEQIKEGVK